jgi:ATP-dependent DNA helicase RecG
MMSDSSAPTRRLRAMERINDGFKLAELDLEMRGPGAIYGTMQHGALDLRIANLSDIKLITAARNSANDFLERGEKLLQYKELNKHIIRLRAVTNLN